MYDKYVELHERLMDLPEEEFKTEIRRLQNGKNGSPTDFVGDRGKEPL